LGTVAKKQRGYSIELQNHEGNTYYTAISNTETVLEEIFSKHVVITNRKLSEISGSNGSEYEDDCLLGCCAV
jgi:hypothetical protein